MKLENDLGYGSIKANVAGERVKFPSVVAEQREQDIMAPVEFTDKASEDQYMADFLNRMDVTVSSSAVNQQGRFLIGEAAIKSGLPLTTFDINALTGKADSDLALIFTLSLIAGKAVKEAYKAGNDLSDPISVEVPLVTALPVQEGKKKGVKDQYKARYLDTSHQVTFHNFTDPVTVTIKFSQVSVANEGETAAVFIASNQNKKLTSGLKADFDKHFPDQKDDVTATDLISSQNKIILDIGGGTVDIIVIAGGRAVAAASASMNEGYDNALDEAVEYLKEQQYNFNDRTQLKEFLAQKVTGLSRKRHERVEEMVYKQVQPFSKRIVENVSKAAGKLSSGIEEVIAVGGGSIPMEEHSDLRERLVNKLKEFNGGDVIPVIFAPAEFAQTLNLDGLEYIQEHLTK
ncbi:ParM/StbA family protein [Limosilactobacillus reuteri]|nr:ParM/StbA family protein [Limosilactobacillus reuteri]